MRQLWIQNTRQYNWRREPRQWLREFEIISTRCYRPNLSTRHKLEYFPVKLLASCVGVLPRPLARGFCQSIALLIYTLHRRLRATGLRNLDLAFPGKNRKEKLLILRRLFKGLGRQLAAAFWPGALTLVVAKPGEAIVPGQPVMTLEAAGRRVPGQHGRPLGRGEGDPGSGPGGPSR